MSVFSIDHLVQANQLVSSSLGKTIDTSLINCNLPIVLCVCFVGFTLSTLTCLSVLSLFSSCLSNHVDEIFVTVDYDCMRRQCPRKLPDYLAPKIFLPPLLLCYLNLLYQHLRCFLDVFIGTWLHNSVFCWFQYSTVVTISCREISKQ